MEGQACGARVFFVVGPGFVGALEVAGDDGYVEVSDEHADAGFEFVEVAAAGAGAFGEEDVGTGFVDHAVAKLFDGVAG